MIVEKPKPKQLLRPITTGAGSAMNQSQFLAITCNLLEAREKSREYGAIGFGFDFDSHWLKNWRESFKPITKRSNRNDVITFDSHLRTALLSFVSKLTYCIVDSSRFIVVLVSFVAFLVWWYYRYRYRPRHCNVTAVHNNVVQMTQGGPAVITNCNMGVVGAHAPQPVYPLMATTGGTTIHYSAFPPPSLSLIHI